MPRPIRERRSNVLLAEDEPVAEVRLGAASQRENFRHSTPERVHVRKLSLRFGQRSMNQPVVEGAVYKRMRSLNAF